MSSFESEYPKLSQIVFRFVARRTGASEETIQDILSQTMISAWKGWHTFRHKSSYLTWVCRIALNKIADYYRQNVNNRSQFIAPFIESLVEPETTTIEEKLALDDLKKAVSGWLTLLSEDQCQLLRLKYWEEASNAQIGQMLGLSPKAVESKLYRARRALASVVAKDGGYDV